jgi:thiol:disulfide interchange protein DsbD
VKHVRAVVRCYVALVICLGFSAANLAAQMPSAKNKITFAPVAPISGRAGDTVEIVVAAKIAKHWHSYGLTPAVGPDGLGPEATVVAVGPKSALKIAGKPRFTKGAHTAFDKTWETNVEELSGSIELRIPVRLSPTLPKGTQKASVNFLMQLCDTSACLPSEDMPQDVSITITDVASSAALPLEDTTESAPADLPGKASETVAAPMDTQQEIEAEKSKGLLSFFLYAMGIGFLALLTPCVFPMIPITVSFFTKRHEKTKGSGLRDSVLFGVGIISTFTAVGIIASILFGGTAVQDLAANPWLNLGIGLLFMALAFNLFGSFEIQVPVSIMNALNKKSQGDGVFSVLLMGLTFSLTSFTCTVPFVGTLLLSASGGDYLYPAVGTLGFATAFAIPFVVLSMFPSLLVRLPRAGGWMNNLKVVMGFLEIAAAVKFFSTAEFIFGLGLLPREVFLAIWAGVCLLIVLYILGTYQLTLDTPVERIGGLRALFAVIFATLGLWFAAGMLGKPLAADLEALLPPENYHELLAQMNGTAVIASTSQAPSKEASDAHGGLVWLNNLDEAKKIAAREGKPIFIDFTGFACVNCRLMEKDVFPRPDVVEQFKKFVLVQLYTDRKTEPYITNQNILKTYGTVANPLYVLLKSDGTYVAQTGFQTQFRSNPGLFVAFLDKAL